MSIARFIIDHYTAVTTDGDKVFDIAGALEAIETRSVSTASLSGSNEICYAFTDDSQIIRGQDKDGAPKLYLVGGIAEKMRAIISWLDWQHVSLSDGLRSVADAEKLYDYWQENPQLPEFADTVTDDNEQPIAPHRIKAIGYDPMDNGE